MRQHRTVFYSAALAMFAAWLLACPQAAKDVTDGGNLAVCIIDHDGEPPEQIVADCQKQGYAVTIDVVTSILTAERASRERHSAHDRISDAGGQ